MKPLVLLSNDDGYAAKGLIGLRAELAPSADVVVCAPELNQSATSHSLSLHRPLRLRTAEPDVFAVDGTPADCVYVALHSGTRVLPRRPDLVVAGVNHGLNLGVDVFYSGTVAAAREGALRGISAVAISADVGSDRPAVSAYAAKLVRAMLSALEAREPKAPPVLLNVNIPRGRDWPIRATRIGARLYNEDVEFRRDPRGREYLWIGGAGVHHNPVEGSDTAAYDDGCVSITPLSLDLYAPDQTPFAAAVAALV